MIITRGRVHEERSTRKPCGLLHLADRLQILRGKSLIFTSKWCEIDQCRYDIISVESLERGVPIRVVHVGLFEIVHLSCMDIEHL